MVMVTDMVILIEPTIMERGALMLNLMVTTAMVTGKRLNTINSLIVAVLKYWYVFICGSPQKFPSFEI